tara:strand:+ start:410 stop:1735 length:1326 start_codon:yes stop_codon:yes gene_type:complete
MSDWNKWAPTPFGSLVERLVNGGTPPTEVSRYWSGDIPWITGADFRENGLTEFRRYVSGEAVRETSTNVITERKLLIVTRTGVGKLAIAPCDVAISQDITGVYPSSEKVDTGFLYHRMKVGLEELKKLNQGTSINGIIRSDLISYEINLPPLPQQRRIAEILSTVDDAIEATEALIAKQQQIKLGLMHDLFTRGVWTAESIVRAREAGLTAAVSAKPGQLRPSRGTAPELYKESPLGWIPKDWEMKELGTMSEIVSGVTLNASSDSGVRIVPYLRVANVQDGYLDLSEVKTVCVSEAQFVKLQLRQGDVLMNEGGDFDKLGRGTVWNCEVEPCVHQNHVFRVRPKTEQLDSHYLAFWSQSHFGKKYFVLNSKQSTNLASINSTQLNKFPVFCPSFVEQKEIVRLLGSVVKKVGALTAETAKLQKQKQGLMQDLLTGRVSVS